jgi:CrcB protein
MAPDDAEMQIQGFFVVFSCTLKCTSLKRYKLLKGKISMTWLSLMLAGEIGLAGAAGAVARYLLGYAIAKHTRISFPYGTLVINVSGALLIGFILALATRHVLSSTSQVILATGFLGGYTTFSTMSWEGVQLAREGNRLQSLLYLGGNVLPGLLAAALGMVLGGWT